MFAVKFRSELEEPVAREFDALMARLNGVLSGAFNEDGTLKSSAIVAAQSAGAPTDEEHNWRSGPWTFDDPQEADPHIAGIRPPKTPAGTYHDYAPKGIDSAVIIELEPDGAVTFTGIKAPSPYRKRVVLFRNRDSTNSITLKHANTGSQPQNQFDLPGNVDFVVGTKQSIWMYYDIGRAAWTKVV